MPSFGACHQILLCAPVPFASAPSVPSQQLDLIPPIRRQPPCHSSRSSFSGHGVQSRERQRGRHTTRSSCRQPFRSGRQLAPDRAVSRGGTHNPQLTPAPEVQASCATSPTSHRDSTARGHMLPDKATMTIAIALLDVLISSAPLPPDRRSRPAPGAPPGSLDPPAPLQWCTSGVLSSVCACFTESQFPIGCLWTGPPSPA